MHARHFLLSPLATWLICSPSAAAPPDGKAVGKPVLVPVWKKTTIGLPKEEYADPDRTAGAREWLAKLYERAIANAHDRSRPLIPPAMPAVRDRLVIYANDEALVARTLVERTTSQKLVPGDLYWQQERNFGLLWSARDWGGRVMLDNFVQQKDGGEMCDRVLHRTLCHSFVTLGSADVYVDDLGLLPASWSKNETGLEDVHGVLTSAIRRSDLNEVDRESGKLELRVGGENRWDGEGPRLFFLSAPIVDDATWYVATESKGTFRLLCLDRTRYDTAYREHHSKKDKAELAIADSRNWETEVAKPPVGLPGDAHRRIHALHLIQSRDVIITPTHLGRVVAVEAKAGKVKWTHEYAPLDAKRFPTFAPEWVVVPPVVVGNRYVYAPADFPELLCLNVADGKKVWTAKKGDGLYPAVVGDQVLVVGEKTVRSLDLKDGTEKWKADLPGLPCGRGAILGDHYLVPVSEPKTWRGMIVLVDVKAGKVTEVVKPDRDEPVGNLVVHQEFLISQTLTEIAVFPIKR